MRSRRRVGSGAVMPGAQVGLASAGAVGPTPALALGAARRLSSTRGSFVRRILLIADALGLALSFLLAQLAFGATTPQDRLSLFQEYLVFLATLPGWVIVAKLYGLYDNDDERADHSTLDDLVGVFHLATVGAWCVFVVAWLSGARTPGTTKLVAFWALAVLLVTAFRGAGRIWSRRRAEYIQKVVVVGAGEVGQLVARKLLQHREYGLKLLGFVDDDPRDLRRDLGVLPVLGSPGDLPRLVEEQGVERVIIAFSGDTHERTVELIRELRGLDVQVDIVPRLFEVVGPHVKLHSLEGIPLVALPPAKRFPGSHAIKRCMDIAGASVALLCAAPLFAFISWRIKRDSAGPIFFRQGRLGLNMEEFTVLKFRTMRTDVDQSVHRDYIKQTMSASALAGENGLFKLDRADAVTKSGTWLRRTSLDELPQLINVLRGEMSLVGPRPCLDYETENFQPHHFERFRVPAGITGLWQVTARAHATFGEALDMDVAYARSWSLGLDVRLLLRTPLHVLRRKGTA